MKIGDKDLMTEGTGIVTFTGKFQKQISYQIQKL